VINMAEVPVVVFLAPLYLVTGLCVGPVPMLSEEDRPPYHIPMSSGSQRTASEIAAEGRTTYIHVSGLSE